MPDELTFFPWCLGVAPSGLGAGVSFLTVLGTSVPGLGTGTWVLCLEAALGFGGSDIGNGVLEVGWVCTMDLRFPSSSFCFLIRSSSAFRLIFSNMASLPTRKPGGLWTPTGGLVAKTPELGGGSWVSNAGDGMLVDEAVSLRDTVFLELGGG